MKVRKSISVKRCMFILSVIVMCGFKFISIPYFLKYGIGILWIVYSYSVRNLDDNGIGKKIILLFELPYLVMFILSPIQILLNPVNGITFISSLSRMLSQMLQASITVGFAYASFRIFGNKAPGMIFKGLVVNNFIGIVSAILRFGILQFVKFITNPLDEIWNTWTPGGRISNALELHEVTFTLGLFLIFFVFYRESTVYSAKKRKYMHLVICIILLFLGFKRIQIMAIAVMFMVSFCVGRSKKNRSFRFFNNWIWIGITVLMYVYLSIISTNIISMIAMKYGINFMSRLEWFASLTGYLKFSPLFLGRGWGTVSLIVDQMRQGAHNDILRNYIEFGFIGFFVWISYYLFEIPRKLLKIKQSTAKIYLFLIVYTMITYMTDNTFTYMIFQTSLMVIVLSTLLDQRYFDKGAKI